MYSILRYGMLLLIPFLLATHHVPKGRFKPNPHFSCDTLRYETQGQVYNFVIYKGSPFKKPPFKDWVYHNPGEDLSSPREVLAYAEKNELLDPYAREQWVHIRPYYLPAHPVTGAEYNDFIKYVRDSVVINNLLQNSKQLPDEQRQNVIELTEKPLHIQQLIRSGILGDFAPNFGESIYDPPFLDKTKFIYSYYSANPGSATTRPTVTTIYPDTFLWMGDQQVAADSSLATAMAEVGWKIKGDNAACINSSQIDAYADWVETEWLKSSLLKDRLATVEVVQAPALSFNIKASVEDISHYIITNKMYLDFATYCLDSALLWYLGGAYITNNRDGTSRINWKTPAKRIPEQLRQNFLAEIKRSGERSYANNYSIGYRYQTIDQKLIESVSRSPHLVASMYPYHFIQRFDEPFLPMEKQWPRLLDVDSEEAKEALDNQNQISVISYQLQTGKGLLALAHSCKVEKRAQGTDRLFNTHLPGMESHASW